MPITDQPELVKDMHKEEVPSAWVELFEIDLTSLGGGVERFCNEINPDGTNVTFGGLAYQALNIKLTGWDMKQSGTLAKPILTVSNVYDPDNGIVGVIAPLIATYKDLVGAKVQRIKTFARFLDSGDTPDSSVFLGPDKMVIEQKMHQDRETVQFQLSSNLDRLGMKIPRRQVLKDQTRLGCAFPGVSKVRINK